MNMKFLIFILFLFTSTIFCQQWQVWLIPDKYVIDKNETLKIYFGITGYGKLEPTNMKIGIYSETGTQFHHGSSPVEYDMYFITPNVDAPKDRFQKIDPKAPKSIILKSDSDSDLGAIFVTPKDDGDKNITFILTYLDENNCWQTSKTEFKYHVNSFSEEYSTALSFLQIIAFAITLLAFVPNNYVSNFIKRIGHSIIKKGNNA